MKKILNTLKLKWAEYLLEIIVIVIGIISAFMLNSWHEANKQKNFEQKMLKEIQSSINSNIDYLDQAIERSEEAAESGRLILGYFKDDLPYHDSLDFHFSRSLFWFHPSLNNNAYESLKSYGLHLITNDYIREELGDIYEWKFIERLSIRQEEYFYSSVSPLLKDWFESYEFIGAMKPLDFVQLKNSEEYRHVLNSMIYNREMQLDYFRDIRQRRLDLVKVMASELGQ